ncbi:hypothetical protein [Hymenobacter pini]|uniref:hypothetical protein n=1 Tax=Hymenobacter pini TaxID=2880879 RepID=UPI001CF4719A|nr:hypothetical protein [Hymenobacter pini]MCA8829657.1 hypothetical protein [Hymenobacter pini]
MYLTTTRRFRSVAAAGLLSATALASTSCDKIKDAVKINFAYNVADVDFTINPTNQTTFSTTASKTSTLQAELDKNKAAVQAVKLKSLQFTLLSTNSNNFGLISSGEAYLSANGSSVKLGEFQNPATNTQTITVPVQNSDDLKQYLQASQFTVELRGTTRQPITQPMQVRAAIGFDVTGKAK